MLSSPEANPTARLESAYVLLIFVGTPLMQADARRGAARRDRRRRLRAVSATLHRPGKIVAIGLNCRDHIREAGVQAPARPLVFAKFPGSLLGHGDAIVIDPALATRVDWEVELAVVVARSMRHVTRDDALDHVAGIEAARG